MRKFAFALLAIFFATVSYAQDDTAAMTDTTAVQSDAKKFSFGFKANVNFASERNAPESRSRTGFAAGFFAEVKLNHRLSLQPELLYSQQGSFQYLYKGVKTKGDNTLQYDYINLPILLKIYVMQDKLSIEVGPQFGYMVSHKEKREPSRQTPRVEKLKKEWMNEFDVSAAIGVSYKCYGPFDIYARYTYGFTDIYKGDIAGMIEADPQKRYFIDNKNSVIQIGLGARF